MLDNSILEMALAGYQAEVQRIEEAMAALRKRLGVRGTTSAAQITTDGSTPKRQMSAAARKRIADAQKKRWAAFHKQHGKPAAKKATAKRTLSPEAKARLAANLAKARAARAAKRATA
jgi:hypothetical protein